MKCSPPAIFTEVPLNSDAVGKVNIQIEYKSGSERTQ